MAHHVERPEDVKLTRADEGFLKADPDVIDDLALSTIHII